MRAFRHSGYDSTCTVLNNDALGRLIEVLLHLTTHPPSFIYYTVVTVRHRAPLPPSAESERHETRPILVFRAETKMK